MDRNDVRSCSPESPRASRSERPGQVKADVVGPLALRNARCGYGSPPWRSMIIQEPSSTTRWRSRSIPSITTIRFVGSAVRPLSKMSGWAMTAGLCVTSARPSLRRERADLGKLRNGQRCPHTQPAGFARFANLHGWRCRRGFVSHPVDIARPFPPGSITSRPGRRWG